MKKDLYFLAADLSMAKAVEAALVRYESFGIRPIKFDFAVHPYRDSGVRTTGHEMLSIQTGQYSHGLMLLDFEGSGTQHSNALDLEAELDKNLQLSWKSNAKAIAIAPELDIWMWGAENVLREILGWSDEIPLRDWLKSQNVQFLSNEKPLRPKEALEKIYYKLKQPKSSSIYGAIASRISLQRCEDHSFLRLKDTLIKWFPR